ncbi:hypothetical protein N7466_007105, partial [Penicillium verhagenii]|uniref:uncharacterized protein n=1 Tax=Penicillium verhagenii TaxID=1562060 RepID=UPI0025459469
MGPYVPPGQSPPFEVVDDFHHGAWIIITAALGLVVSLVCCLIRLYVRLMLMPPFARDDVVLLGATGIGIIQSILVFYACSRGLGTSLSLLNESRLVQIQTVFATSDVFALVVIYLSKCCVVTIYLRLTPQKPHNWASWATLALCTAWLIPAAFILLVDCELNQPWRVQGGQCRNLYKRWQFIAAVDIITEIILFSLAVALLKGLFMSVKRKLGIGFAFIFRFPLIVFALLHMSTLHSSLADNDVTLAAVKPALWLQVQLHYALVACSVFCLRPFMAAVSTNYGTAGDSNLESSASASRSRGTKESSKSGSGSGSNADSRSRSLSRVRRKRAGTGAGLGSASGIGLLPRSGSKEALCRDACVGGDGADAGRGESRQKIPKQAVWMHGAEGGGGGVVRAPVRRSLFALAGSGRSVKSDKGGVGARDQGGSALEFESDALELMPQLHRQYGRRDEDGVEDPDKMVIRKEVEYSVRFERGRARRKCRLMRRLMFD